MPVRVNSPKTLLDDMLNLTAENKVPPKRLVSAVLRFQTDKKVVQGLHAIDAWVGDVSGGESFQPVVLDWFACRLGNRAQAVLRDSLRE